MARNDANNTQYSSITPTELKNDYGASATPKSSDNDVIASSKADDDQCSEVSEEVPGTIPPPKFNM
jgi:hypothetical protein